MRKLLATVAILGLSGYGAIACSGSSSPSKPAVSHADQLACRTVYRLVQLANISPVAISDQQAANSLTETAVGTTPKSFNESLVVTAQEIGLTGNSVTILGPLVTECTGMGITAKNAEQVSG